MTDRGKEENEMAKIIVIGIPFSKNGGTHGTRPSIQESKCYFQQESKFDQMNAGAWLEEVRPD